MRFNERRRIQLCGDSNSNSTWGCIELEHLAKPETMEITIQGETIIPESFDIYGQPIISEEMAMLCRWKEEQVRRNPETKDFWLEAEISYEEQEFTIPREMLDTVKGIEISLISLSAFNEMLNNRCLWRKATGKKTYLNEFVIFGRYQLDAFGQVLTIKTTIDISNFPNVCTLDDFNALVSEYSASYSTYIPKEGTSCPCCGKKFTIDDLRNTVFNLTNGKISHDSCSKNYYHNKEIDKMSTNLIDLVYDENPKFDLLPNGYCSRECCKHIPWFLFHTSDGDIKIGWRKRVISIEWQENFKPFDMAIFNDEEVTKWCNNSYIYKAVEAGTNPTNGIRGIHAWGREKAYEYLEKVKEIVNTDKKK